MFRVQDVHAGFLELIDGLARDHPVLLIFEDAHTLRPAMLDLVERIGSPGRRGPRRAQQAGSLSRRRPSR